MNVFNVLVIRLLLFMIVAIILAIITLVIVSNKQKNVIAEEHNALAIGASEVRIEKSEIINRFFDYQMDAFLRRTYKGLRSWNPVHEERVGFHWEGLHVVTCHLLNGNQFNVSVYVKPDHITPELYEQPKEQENIVTFEEIAAAWMTKWNSELVAHATQGTGFAIPDAEFPQEAEAVDIITDTIIMQGDFSIMHDDEDGCFRLAYNMTA